MTPSPRDVVCSPPGPSLGRFWSFYRGHENPFGHIHHNLDGANCQVQSAGAGGKSYLWVADDPADWSDAGYTNYTNVGEIPRASGYVSKVHGGSAVHWGVKTAAGSATTYFCDNSGTTIPGSGTNLSVVRTGAAAQGTTECGLTFFNSGVLPSQAYTSVGFRLSYKTS